jgi:expansin (peptidoglycan-binding protein)
MCGRAAIAAGAVGLGLGLGVGACRDPEPPAPPAAAPERRDPGCAAGQIAATGVATYYDATGAGSCSFDPLPAGAGDRLVAALNGPDWSRAAWCGACLAVVGPRGEVVVRVVDQCPGCKHGDLDLSRDAFAAIAPLSAGRTKIAWHAVACPVTGPVIYQLKAGTNPQWAAIQLRNHRHAIAGLDVRDAAGGYRALTRTVDNYFVATGLGAGPLALRVRDVHGHTVEDPAIALGAGVARPGAAQLPSCP